MKINIRKRKILLLKNTFGFILLERDRIVIKNKATKSPPFQWSTYELEKISPKTVTYSFTKEFPYPFA